MAPTNAEALDPDLTAEDVAREADIELETARAAPARALKFLTGFATNPYAHAVLSAHGFTEAVRQRGLALIVACTAPTTRAP